MNRPLKKEIRSARRRETVLLYVNAASTFFALLAAAFGGWAALSTQRQADIAYTQINLSERNQSIKAAYEGINSFCTSLQGFNPPPMTIWEGPNGYFENVDKAFLRGITVEEREIVKSTISKKSKSLIEETSQFFLWHTEVQNERFSDFIDLFPSDYMVHNEDFYSGGVYQFVSFGAALARESSFCITRERDFLRWVRDGMPNREISQTRIEYWELPERNEH